MKHHEEIFEDTEVTLDNQEYFGCSFKRCQVHYSGGGSSLRVADFDSCNFVFGGSAARTVKLLQMLFQSGESGHRMVDNLLREPYDE